MAFFVNIMRRNDGKRKYGSNSLIWGLCEHFNLDMGHMQIVIPTLEWLKALILTLVLDTSII